MDITGRKLFVKALEEEGVDTIFGYPGGTVTDLFDELYKQRLSIYRKCCDIEYCNNSTQWNTLNYILKNIV